MYFFLPPNTPTGKPPPTIFPSVVMSGWTSKNCCAPPFATRNPVITSSNINIELFLLHNVLIFLKKDLSGITQFIFPAIGSTIIQAICLLYFLKHASTWEELLYSSEIVCFVRSFGIPGDEGTPNVAAPDPALTKRESTCPW